MRDLGSKAGLVKALSLQPGDDDLEALESARSDIEVQPGDDGLEALESTISEAEVHEVISDQDKANAVF